MSIEKVREELDRLDDTLASLDVLVGVIEASRVNIESIFDAISLDVAELEAENEALEDENASLSDRVELLEERIEELVEQAAKESE